ncbi:MAG TPA: hypothetical protein PK167_04140 [Prolixibacteraceae bacterium]|nr:hypothetical protein [Prolixibacteraceae bacterium]
MYWSSIFWFLTWPVLVIFSHYLVRFMVKKYEAKLEKDVPPE